jgi:hypothetical protein
MWYATEVHPSPAYGENQEGVNGVTAANLVSEGACEHVEVWTCSTGYLNAQNCQYEKKNNPRELSVI